MSAAPDDELTPTAPSTSAAILPPVSTPNSPDDTASIAPNEPRPMDPDTTCAASATSPRILPPTPIEMSEPANTRAPDAALTATLSRPAITSSRPTAVISAEE